MKLKSKNKLRNIVMISVVTIIVLLGAVYIRKLISPHTINPYNVKYSSGKYIDGALSARESSILINILLSLADKKLHSINRKFRKSKKWQKNKYVKLNTLDSQW